MREVTILTGHVSNAYVDILGVYYSVGDAKDDLKVLEVRRKEGCTKPCLIKTGEVVENYDYFNVETFKVL